MAGHEQILGSLYFFFFFSSVLKMHDIPGMQFLSNIDTPKTYEALHEFKLILPH